MRRFLLTVAAAALSLTLVAAAEAAPRGGASHDGRSGYHLTHGTKFKGGYFYKGRDHHHWTYRYWYGKYGCYTYYCPSTCCWYYYYPRQDCYYPVSYIANATPVAEAAPVGVPSGVTQIVNVANNSPGAATGAAPMPPAPPGP